MLFVEYLGENKQELCGSDSCFEVPKRIKSTMYIRLKINELPFHKYRHRDAKYYRILSGDRILTAKPITNPIEI